MSERHDAARRRFHLPRLFYPWSRRLMLCVVFFCAICNNRIERTVLALVWCLLPFILRAARCLALMWRGPVSFHSTVVGIIVMRVDPVCGHCCNSSDITCILWSLNVVGQPPPFGDADCRNFAIRGASGFGSGVRRFVAKRVHHGKGILPFFFV